MVLILMRQKKSKSVDLDRNEPSHQDLHFLLFDSRIPYLQQWMCPYSKTEECIAETQR